jgi:hypothetical protein
MPSPWQEEQVSEIYAIVAGLEALTQQVLFHLAQNVAGSQHG